MPRKTVALSLFWRTFVLLLLLLVGVLAAWVYTLGLVDGESGTRPNAEQLVTSARLMREALHLLPPADRPAAARAVAQHGNLKLMPRTAADGWSAPPADRWHGQLAELARLRRLMVRLQRLLAPEPSALQRTLAKPPGWVSAHDLQHLLRSSEEFALVLRDVGALQERIRLMQDEAATRVAEENNRSVFVLTMVTVLALPINLVAGLLGMNVGGIPMAQHERGFWWTLALIASLTGGVAALVVGRLRPRRS